MAADIHRVLTSVGRHLRRSALLLLLGAIALPAAAQNAVNSANVAPPVGVQNSGTTCTATNGAANYNATTGVCTAVDSDPIQPRLTLLKTVVNDNGGVAPETAWTLTATGLVTISGAEGATAVTNASVSAGTYALSESGGPAGYTASAYSCVINGAAAVSGNSLTLAAGDVATCTITNDDQAATLTLLKTVVNDNGGLALDTAWTLTATGPTTGVTGTEGQAAITSRAVSAGTYTLTEAGGPAGYIAGNWTCTAGTLAGNSLVLASGQNASCSITNDDQPATLTLRKTVVNDNAGTALNTAWTLTATGPTTGVSGTEGQAAVTNRVVSAGTYTLTETGGPAGYTASAWTCTAGILTGNSLVLANGQNASCTITNDDRPASLTLVKNVVNTGGGTATAANFTLTAISGATTVSGVSGSPAVTAAPVPAGTYALSETNVASYQPSQYSCAVNGGAAVAGNSVALAVGDQATCTVTNTFQPAPALTIDKTAGTPSGTTVGSTIAYTFLVTNTGNVTLTGIVVNDAQLDAAAVCPVTTLAPGASTTCTGTHTITQPEVDAGTSNNSATASGTDPTGGTPTSPPDTTTTPIAPAPALTSTKAMTANADEDGDGAISLGDTLTYTITATNTGNVTLTGVVVTDNKITPNSVTCATVDPAATCVLTGTYRVTQADADTGQVVNAAVVTTATPGACPAGSTAPECNPSVTVPVKQEPRLASVKAMTANADEDGNGAVSVGDTLTYSITVTNTGNVSLTDVVVTDTKITPNSVTCATLAPAATCVLTGTYRVTQADAAAGQVVNAAVVTTATPGVCPAGSTAAECNPTVTVNVTGRPAIAAAKTATLTTDLGTPGKGNAGDVITYAVTVTNTGDVPLIDLKTLDTFENGTPTTLTCAPTTLAPGAMATCNSYTHTITEAEANAGGTLDNVIVASGTYGTTTQTVTVSATSTAVVTVEPEPTALRVSKQANPRDVKTGDLVRYTVTIENLGQAAASDVTMIDTPPAGFSYVEGSLRVADGDNAGRLVGTFPVRVDQIDIEAGGRATVAYLLRVGAGVRPGVHVNRAYAEDGGVRSNVATAEVQLVADPVLDESLILGTVFDDRDEDGWQDPAELSGIRVQGGFAAGAYVANSTTVDRGNGPAPEPDASSPMLHGIELGKIAGRQSDADPAAAHTVVISQKLSTLEFTDDFAMTTAQGLTLRLDREGNSRVERSGDAGKGLTGADPKVERRVAQVEGGYQVDYIVSNAGVDERGIPGVRLATVEGLLIETDQFGRYHLEGVPGGAWERGRNFIVKVDPATLPPGSQLTTDNPLVRRITPGVPVRFDFGVKLPPGEIPGGRDEVEMRIGEVFFAPGSAAVTPQYLPAVEKMAEKVREYGGGEVVIVAQGEHETLAMDRALAVRKALEASLTAEQLKALTVSVRTQAEFPESMVVGFSEWPLLGEVLFDTDRSTIKAKYRPLIAKMAAAIDQMRATRIVITGHTDKRASDDYNVALGMRRAKAVYDAIAEKISPELRAKFRVDLSNDPAAPAGNEK